MHKRAGFTVLLLGILAATGALGLRAAPGAAQAEPKGPELAVYNQGLALVKETRTLSLTQGTQPVAISDVPAQIDPTSVYFKSLTDPAGTVVLEQNFEYDHSDVDDQEFPISPI